MKPKDSQVDNTAIADRLNKELVTLGCLPERGKIADAAKIMGITAPSARKIIRGSSLPSAETLASLARLGVDINWLLTGEPVKTSRSRRQESIVAFRKASYASQQQA